MDKNYVKASYNTTSGFHDVNESKWCNAYADDAIPCTVWIFLILASAEPTFLPLLRISRRGEMLPNVDAMAKT